MCPNSSPKCPEWRCCISWGELLTSQPLKIECSIAELKLTLLPQMQVATTTRDPCPHHHAAHGRQLPEVLHLQPQGDNQLVWKQTQVMAGCKIIQIEFVTYHINSPFYIQPSSGRFSISKLMACPLYQKARWGFQTPAPAAVAKASSLLLEKHPHSTFMALLDISLQGRNRSTGLN